MERDMKSIPPVHMMTGYMTGNIYIIEGEDELVLVDAGVEYDYKLIVDRIKSLGRSPVEISHILLTHFHVDHAGAAAALKRLSGARVVAYETEVPFIQGKQHVSSVYKMGVLGRAVSLVPKAAATFTRVPAVDVDVPLKNGEELPVLGGFELMAAPGHTPGTSCYFWREKGILFSGDAIINTYHRFTLPTIGFSYDFDEAARSACRVVDVMEDEDVWLVCTGHGPMVDDRAKEKLLKFRGKLMKKGKYGDLGSNG
jgi:glyoxylase-like metal-dependent hydrolase (beta-lactamase superfamily II)